jgi:hypothetical protein
MVKPEHGDTKVSVLLRVANAKSKGTAATRVEVSTHHTIGPNKIK